MAAALAANGCGGDDDGVTPGADADPHQPDADPSAPDGATSCSGELTLCGGQCVDTSSNADFCGDCETDCPDNQACLGGECVSGVTGVVLAELHAQPPAYFELYNGAATAIDLTGYQVQWASDSGVTGSLVLPAVSLDPGGFLILAEGPQPGDLDPIPGTVHLGDDVNWSTAMAVRLLAPGGAGVDFVRTGTSTVAPPAGTGWLGANAANPSALYDESLVRNVYHPDSDGAADWSIVSHGSPGAYCGRPGRCGDACLDWASDRASCGGCGRACGGAQVCRNGRCEGGSDHLWISEYRRLPRAGVEIHNPTGATIDLTSYQLDVIGPTTLSYTFPAASIAPGAYLFLLMGDGLDTPTALFVGPTTAFSADIAVALYDRDLVPLDFVRFGSSAAEAPSGTFWFGDNVPQPSVELGDVAARRKLSVLDSDSAADWVHDTPSTPGFGCYPGMTECDGACVALAADSTHCGECGNPCGPHQTCRSGLCASVGGVALSEVGRGGFGDALEVFNGTAAAADLSGWRLEWVGDTGGAGSYDLPAGTTVEAGAFLHLTEQQMSATLDWNEYLAVSLKDDAAVGVDFVRTGASLTMPPAGTVWVGDGALNPTGGEALRRDVYTADGDGAGDWTLAPPSVASYCRAGESACEGACVVTASDRENCGACGNRCGLGGACFAGACVDEGTISFRDNEIDSGYPRIFHADQWGFLCNALSVNEATVLCRQMGFNSGSAGGSSFSDAFKWMSGLACAGGEPRLDNCPFDGWGASCSYVQYVQCAP